VPSPQDGELVAGLQSMVDHGHGRWRKLARAVSHRGARGAFYRLGNGAEQTGGGRSSGGRWYSINSSVT
jgi:hypothetical protein